MSFFKFLAKRPTIYISKNEVLKLIVKIGSFRKKYISIFQCLVDYYNYKQEQTLHKRRRSNEIQPANKRHTKRTINTRNKLHIIITLSKFFFANLNFKGGCQNAYCDGHVDKVVYIISAF